MPPIVTCVLMVLCISNYARGNPLSSEKQSPEYEAYRTTRLIQATSRDLPRFRQSWAFLTLPSLPSVGSFFGDEDDSMNSLRQRVDALERAQKELLSLLQQTKEAIRADACNCQKQGLEEVEGAKSESSSEATSNGEKGVPGPIPIKDETQSALTTTKLEQMNAPTPSKKSVEGEDLSSGSPKENVRKLQEQSHREIAPSQEGNQAESPSKPDEGKTLTSDGVEKLGKSKSDEENLREKSVPSLAKSDTAIQAEVTDTDKQDVGIQGSEVEQSKGANSSKKPSSDDGPTNEPQSTDPAEPRTVNAEENSE